jgi:hypothetical protein
MFDILVGSRPIRGGRLAGTAFSAVAHATLITVALAATQGTSPYAHGDREVVPAEHVSYVTPSQVLRQAASETKNAQTAVRKAVDKLLTLSAALLDVAANVDHIDIQVPDIHLDDALNDQTADWLSHPDALTSDTATKTLAQTLGALVVHPLAGGIYTPDMVDRIVAPRPGNPTPRYPAMLLSAGVEQTLDVTFVVDTTGHVEEPTIAFPSSAHHLFVDAVKSALLRSRYFPAFLGGHLVPQLVEQEFRFVVR